MKCTAFIWKLDNFLKMLVYKVCIENYNIKKKLIKSSTLFVLKEVNIFYIHTRFYYIFNYVHIYYLLYFLVQHPFIAFDLCALENPLLLHFFEADCIAHRIPPFALPTLIAFFLEIPIAAALVIAF